MRYRLMATYQGVPYEAGIGPTGGDVVLFAACPPPEDLGFEPATGHWRKQLRVPEVQALWESRPMGRYRGQRCLVLDDLGDRLHIAYLGHDAYQAQQLGYWQVDRGVFELVTPRDEVTEVTEERFDYPEQPAGQAAAPTGSYDPAAADSGPVTADLGPVTADLGPVTADLALATAATADLGPRSANLGPLTADYEPATADYGAPAVDYGPGTSGSGVRNQAGLTPAPAPPGSRPPSSPGGRLESPGQPSAASPALPPPGFMVSTPASEPPLPLEAAALRAASAAALPRQNRLSPDSRLPPDLLAAPRATAIAADRPAPARGDAAPRRRRSARSRMATQGIFIELATLAAIPAAAYAVGEEVDGALCLIETPTGYEVFSAAGGARHEVRVFEDEESAYFYLFGVLAAEAVRTGLLIPHR